MTSLLLLGGLATALAAEGKVVTWAVDEHTTGIYIEDHRAPLVTAWVQVPVGRWDEGTVDAGILEAWNTQDDDAEAALRTRADALAISVGTGVKTGRSYLRARFLAEDVDAARGLLGDVLTNRSYDEAQFARDAKAEVQDWELGKKDPETALARRSVALTFDPEDPRYTGMEAYSAPVRDSETLAALRDRMLRTPGRTVAFAGDLSLEQAKAFAEGLLPAADPAEVWTDRPDKQLLDRPGREEVTVPGLTQAYLRYYKLGPTVADPDYPAWVLAQHVLAGHFFSRVSVALRHDGGDTYSASGFYYIADEPRLTGINTYTRTANRAAFEEKLVATMTTFHSEGITQGELDDALRYFRGKQLMRMQSPGQQLSSVMFNLGTHRPIDWHLLDPEAMEAFSLEQVNAVIRTHFDPSDFTLLVALPE